MVSAEQAKLNQIAASKRFIAGAGQDAFDVTASLSVIARNTVNARIARSKGNSDASFQNSSRIHLERIKKIVARGRVNYTQIQNSNRNLIRNFVGLFATTITGGKVGIVFINVGAPPQEQILEEQEEKNPFTIKEGKIIKKDDMEERVIDRVAERLERTRKVKDGTSTEIARIVEVGITGGDQIGTS